MITEDAKFIALHEHYDDTFKHVQKYLKARDKYFLFLLVTIILMLFQIFSSIHFATSISQLLSKKFELDGSIDIIFLGSILWFVLLACTIRYFQTVTHIERQYNYLHNLEEQLNKYYPNTVVFTREGISYLINFPLLSNWAWMLYTILFPLILFLIVTIKIINEVKTADSISFLLIVNILFCFTVLVSIILYSVSLHLKK